MTQSKQSVGLATVWIRMNDYKKARWKLTGMYILMFFVMLNLFTVSLFVILQKVENDYVQKTETVYKKQIVFSVQNVTVLEWSNDNNTNKQDIIKLHREFLSDIRYWIVVIEIVLLILAGLISYWLSGRTLQPIQKKNKEQKQFLADVSHELKNPLSALQTSLEVAKKQEDWTNAEVQEMFDDLTEEIVRLTKITQDLIVLEKDTQIKEKCNIAQICNGQIGRLVDYAKQRNININQNLADYKCLCPVQDLERVVYNLLHNAIKFSNPNSDVDIELTKKGVLTIKDSGLGIAKKDKPFIFDRFYKGDTSRTFSTDTGSGLGLSIVKKIVDRNNWKISVKSEQDSGTIFEVML